MSGDRYRRRSRSPRHSSDRYRSPDRTSRRSRSPDRAPQRSRSPDRTSRRSGSPKRSNRYSSQEKERSGFSARQTDQLRVREQGEPPRGRYPATAAAILHGDEGRAENSAAPVYMVPTQQYCGGSGGAVQTSKIAAAPVPTAASRGPAKKKLTVANAFNCDSSEDETEEIPMHARMRMRNLGKDTPTSAGPNSFGKTKRGFTDTVKLWEKDPVKVAQKIVGKRSPE